MTDRKMNIESIRYNLKMSAIDLTNTEVWLKLPNRRRKIAVALESVSNFSLEKKKISFGKKAASLLTLNMTWDSSSKYAEPSLKSHFDDQYDFFLVLTLVDGIEYRVLLKNSYYYSVEELVDSLNNYLKQSR